MIDVLKQCCWNCIYCDTFGGVCVKGKFKHVTNKIHLETYRCDLYKAEDFIQIKLMCPNCDNTTEETLYKTTQYDKWTCVNCNCAEQKPFLKEVII